MCGFFVCLSLIFLIVTHKSARRLLHMNSLEAFFKTPALTYLHFCKDSACKISGASFTSSLLLNTKYNSIQNGSSLCHGKTQNPEAFGCGSDVWLLESSDNNFGEMIFPPMKTLADIGCVFSHVILTADIPHFLAAKCFNVIVKRDFFCVLWLCLSFLLLHWCAADQASQFST